MRRFDKNVSNMLMHFPFRASIGSPLSSSDQLWPRCDAPLLAHQRLIPRRHSQQWQNNWVGDVSIAALYRQSVYVFYASRVILCICVSWFRFALEDGAIQLGSLLLKNITLEDLDATFTCVVINSAGMVHKNVTLTAKGDGYAWGEKNRKITSG